jgi:osomolarity two-component system, response regulator SSK1
MSGIKLPAVRLPSTHFGEEGQGIGQDVVLELPPSNKFGFAWPTDSTAPVQSLEHPPMFTSSSEQSDSSEVEITPSSGKSPQFDTEDESTPTSRLKPQSMLAAGPSPPRFPRAFSMPLPSQLGHLQNPRRTSSSSASPPSPIIVNSPGFSQFHELSLELADSVQMMIQTLLQVSPSQILDPAKEQFSACSLSIPTPSLSAMLTSMKNLNYISANMATFCTEPPDAPHPHDSPHSPCATMQRFNDFDIGEMLQSVGDVLSGVAAQAGVDLVLFHGDVGMKHVSVRGDENGISYALAHVSLYRPCQSED